MSSSSRFDTLINPHHGQADLVAMGGIETEEAPATACRTAIL